MIPGTTVRPRRSITCVLGGAAPRCGRALTATKRPSRIVSELATVFRASIVWMRPLTSISACGACAASLAAAMPAPAVVPRNVRREISGTLLLAIDERLIDQLARQRPHLRRAAGRRAAVDVLNHPD